VTLPCTAGRRAGRTGSTRRAEFAASGFLLDGPDERTDGMDQKSHAELIGLAHRTGRVRQSDESVA
jgi:hypothetical protein